MTNPAKTAPGSGPKIQRDSAIAADWLAGSSTRQVAAKHGVSQRTALRVLHRASIDTEARNPKSARHAATMGARQAKVAELRAAGKTMPEIAAELDVSVTTVWKDVHALGLETRMGPPPKYPPLLAGRTCQRCGEPIPHRPPSHGRQGGRVNGQTLGDFCSRECFLERVKTGVVNECPVCGRRRYRPASQAHKKCCGYGCSNVYGSRDPEFWRSNVEAMTAARRGAWWNSAEGKRFLELIESGQVDAICWLCGDRRDVPPSELARAWREDRRFACSTCWPLWRSAFLDARWSVVRAHTPGEALRASLARGEDLRQALREAHPPRRGQPRDVSLDLAIETLHSWRGLSDEQITRLLRTEGRYVEGRYVKTRRRRAKIKRPEYRRRILTPPTEY